MLILLVPLRLTPMEFDDGFTLTPMLRMEPGKAYVRLPLY